MYRLRLAFLALHRIRQTHAGGGALEARLEALRRTSLLDSPPEEAFDRLTRVATTVLRVPISIVSLVDRDRLFFKSQSGLGEPFASLRQGPVQLSFCQHAVRTRETLAGLAYDYPALERLMARQGWTTAHLFWSEDAVTFHARNPFPPGGVVEDPATGAAAAAFGGYLRDLGLAPVPSRVLVHQGHDMDAPSELLVDLGPAAEVAVSGRATQLAPIHEPVPGHSEPLRKQRANSPIGLQDEHARRPFADVRPGPQNAHTVLPPRVQSSPSCRMAVIGRVRH